MIDWPEAEKLETLADLTSDIAGPWLAGMVSELVAVTHGPLGGVPFAVPVLEMEPLVTSPVVVT